MAHEMYFKKQNLWLLVFSIKLTNLHKTILILKFHNLVLECLNIYKQKAKTKYTIHSTNFQQGMELVS